MRSGPAFGTASQGACFARFSQSWTAASRDQNALPEVRPERNNRRSLGCGHPMAGLRRLYCDAPRVPRGISARDTVPSCSRQHSRTAVSRLRRMHWAHRWISLLYRNSAAAGRVGRSRQVRLARTPHRRHPGIVSCVSRQSCNPQPDSQSSAHSSRVRRYKPQARNRFSVLEFTRNGLCAVRSRSACDPNAEAGVAIWKMR